MAEVLGRGAVRKMHSHYEGAGTPIAYSLPLGDGLLPLNALLGSSLSLNFSGLIFCHHCQRQTKKSFGQGFCYPCWRKLPATDLCQVKPETCHFARGTCRDSAWGQAHCFISHTLYLANASGLKVGITRTHQQMTRWMDQGAATVLPLLQTSSRLDAGLIEVALAQHVADKTNWRKMLQGVPAAADLAGKGDELRSFLPPGVGYEPSPITSPIHFHYPVLTYPKKLVSLNLDKTPTCGGTLLGIKGQYLMFDTGVINMRKYAGYELSVERH